MANNYAGPGGSVNITPGLNRMINKLVKAVVKGAQKAGKQSLYDMRDTLRDGIKNNSMGLAPLRPGTLLARKNPTPTKPRSTRDQPLYYSGETLKGIKVKINNTSMVLGFDEGATIYYNKQSMAYVASLQESGFPIQGTYTKKQLAYLHMLFRKDSRTAKAKSADTTPIKDAKVGLDYDRTVPARPAWKIAEAKTLPKVETNFVTCISEAIQKLGLGS